LYFGDTSGYYFFDPSSFLISKPPEILFTNFSIGNQPVKPSENGALQTELWKAEKISIGYDQNGFAFEFIPVDYNNPPENHTLYKLENYDNEWRITTNPGKAYYYNVPPGKYIFKVKASNNMGVWAGKDISVTIAPPWWRTWWAYCLYGLLFIIVVYLVHRVQKQRVINAERERTRERELEQAKEIEKAYHELKVTQSQLIQSEKMASLGELTAGIAHEIQNPLNFVNNFSEVNKELIEEMKKEMLAGNQEEAISLADNVIENEEKINHHGKRADAIVKGMLQHSRSSTGQKEITDINALVNEYLRLSYHGMRAKDKSFNATRHTDFDNSVGKINIIPQDIGRVLLNLFNNAFYSVTEKKKHQTEGYEPIISVSTKRISDKVEIRVRDNGIGIPQKVLDKIYQPFFTTKPTGEGTGLGLSLSYDIITKEHNGTIKANTKEGEFAEFIIQLPN
jgi:signal transduction histidine kinase